MNKTLAGPTSGIVQEKPGAWRVFHGGQYCQHVFSDRMAAVLHLAAIDQHDERDFPPVPSTVAAIGALSARALQDCWDSRLNTLARDAARQGELPSLITAMVMNVARSIAVLPAEKAGDVIAKLLNLAEVYREQVQEQRDARPGKK